MNSINPYFFSDPYIRPSQPFPNPASVPSRPTPIRPPEPPQTKPPVQPVEDQPQITKDLWDLKNHKVIVYRNPNPTSVCAGPDIRIPILNLEIQTPESTGDFEASCISTYPKEAPFSPIADRFEVRFFKDSFILTLTDGCGLHPSSRLAPKAAIDGFWNYLAPKIEQDNGQFDVHKMGLYLKSAIKAAHFNIYWDAYSRSQEGFTALQENVSHALQDLEKASSESAAISEILNLRKEHLEQEIQWIQKALGGDLETQKALVEKNLATRFYEDYAGATTFMCSALLKNASSSEFPYFLLTLNLGDGQCFILRNSKLMEMTQDTRSDLSNVRDPGGKIGLCSPVPLKMDMRNLQFSLTPCTSEDLLLFMTDGVLDNLNPERLGVHPRGLETPYWIQEKIREAGHLTGDQFESLMTLLDAEETSWKELPLDRANALRSKFVQQLLEFLVLNAPSFEKANEHIITFCSKITEGHRENSSSYSFEEPLGKPDHTTCLTYLIP